MKQDPESPQKTTRRREVQQDRQAVGGDLVAGLVVFLIALPLCLGIALASGTPLVSGLVSGIIGGVVVGLLSGSSTSVSGPAAGLTAVVAAQVEGLGSFDAFLLAVVIAGAMQIALGLLKAGVLSSFFPTSVIQGLLAAIGMILILKQVPHLLGHDTDPEGEMSFSQPDHENTFSEILRLFNGEIHPGAVVVGVAALLVLMVWDRFSLCRRLAVPAPLLAVLLGCALKVVMDSMGGIWLIESTHLVQVPSAGSVGALRLLLQHPDWSRVLDPAVWGVGLTVCIVASLETLLNLEAIDKLDPRRRVSPPNRELIAQGTGNILCGLLGGLPITSVIVRSSVNIQAGAASRLSAVFHGVLLAACVILIPEWLNQIPLSALAAILLHTGMKLFNPGLMRRMYADGLYQFAPFVGTLLSIVLTDLLTGVACGLAISITFILMSNMQRPVAVIKEQRFGEEITHVQLANQVSFLNRGSLQRLLDATPSGAHLAFDATATNFIDPDIVAMLRDFQQTTGPARDIRVSTVGFREYSGLANQILYTQYSTQELQQRLSPDEIMQVLLAGNARFRAGQQLVRDLHRQMGETAAGQHPLAIILGCIDSRAPAEIVFDVGLGEVFSTRIAGNVVRSKVLGSLEYACAVAGARVILVMGHTRCGAVSTAVGLAVHGRHSCSDVGCQHLDIVIEDIQQNVSASELSGWTHWSEVRRQQFVDDVARRNTIQSAQRIYEGSSTLRNLADTGRILIAAALYNLENGSIEILHRQGIV
jgi:carbonic anhydrase/SulP family sulfate permease